MSRFYTLSVLALFSILKFTNVDLYLLPFSNCPLSCECEINDVQVNKLKLMCTTMFIPFYTLPSDFLQNPDLEKLNDLTITGDVEYFPLNFCTHENLMTVRIEHTKLKTLFSGSLTCLTKLTFLYLNYNEITEIKKNYFNNIQNLFILELSNNIITIIENEAFNNLPKLFKLDLSNNNIRIIESNPFNNMFFLSLIYISNNEIEEILGTSFKDLPFLSGLFLSNNKLKDMGDSVKGILSLTDLDLSHNLLTQINIDSIINLNIIKTLNMSNNILTEIEMWPLYLWNIENVDLRNNLIKTFSNKQQFHINKHDVSGFSDSTVINLSNNLIETFDDNTLEMYGVLELHEYEMFFNKYLKSFIIDANPIECNCLIQRRIIEYSSMLNLKRTYSIKCKNSAISIFDQNCKNESNATTSSTILSTEPTKTTSSTITLTISYLNYALLICNIYCLITI